MGVDMAKHNFTRRVWMMLSLSLIIGCSYCLCTAAFYLFKK